MFTVIPSVSLKIESSAGTPILLRTASQIVRRFEFRGPIPSRMTMEGCSHQGSVCAGTVLSMR